MANNQNRKKKKRYSGKQNKNWNTKSKYMGDYKEETSDRETNDPAWYAQYPELMRDAASIPYSIPTGTYVKLDYVEDSSIPVPTTGALAETAYQSVPGIMTLGIAPSPGVSTGPTSPINVATKMLYTKVRAENSGARNYDAPDLMLYCLGMDQIYSLLTWYNRIYGILMLYSQVNRYIPRELLVAQKVNFDDLILHINDFKAFLDTATAQAAVFSVPADMKLFNRHAFMYQNVYKDAESAKAQLYQFAPRLFYYYDEFNGAGRLMPIDILNDYPNGLTFSDLVSLFYRLANPIIASEDFNIMSGDILKAFGEGNLIKLQLMPQGYTIIPITDYEVLTQIKNATISALTNSMLVNIAADPVNWSIHQDANVEFIEYNPYIDQRNTGARNWYVKDRYLSTYKTAPEPADNMVYSRLMYTTDEIEETDPNTGTSIWRSYFNSVGSEFVTGVSVTSFHYDVNGNWIAEDMLVNSASEVLTTVSTISQLTNLVTRLGFIKHFDFAPALYLFCRYSSNGTVARFMPIFDLDNWTIVHAYELEKMHRTALMSMLRVPMIGSALPSNMKS